jgi:hypothetical protein
VSERLLRRREQRRRIHHPLLLEPALPLLDARSLRQEVPEARQVRLRRLIV